MSAAGKGSITRFAAGKRVRVDFDTQTASISGPNHVHDYSFERAKSVAALYARLHAKRPKFYLASANAADLAVSIIEGGRSA